MKLNKESIIEVLKIVFIISIGIVLFIINLKIGYIISDILGIPHNIAISIWSPGFYIEVAILLLVTEMIILVKLYEKVRKLSF